MANPIENKTNNAIAAGVNFENLVLVSDSQTKHSILTDQTDSVLNDALKYAIKKFLEKEYSVENWDFLIEMQKLSAQTTASPKQLKDLFDKFIDPKTAISQINIPSSMTAALVEAFKNNPNKVQISHFNDAAKEIIKLLNGDTLKRIVNLKDPDVFKALKPIEELKEKISLEKTYLQVKGLEIFQSLQEHSQPRKLIELPVISNKKSSFTGRRTSLDTDDPQPFNTASQLTSVMTREIENALRDSNNMSPKDFTDNFKNDLKRNMTLLNQLYENADKKLLAIEQKNGAIPKEDLQQLKTQLKDLAKVIGSMDLLFKSTFTPAQEAQVKTHDGINKMMDQLQLRDKSSPKPAPAPAPKPPEPQIIEISQTRARR